MRHALLAALVAAPLTTGCLADEADNPYAIYKAGGAVSANCGDTGLLVGPAEMSLRVGIRLVGNTGFHWDQGDGILMGVIDDSASFSVSRYMRVDVRPGDDDNAACIVERTMIVEGSFDGLVDTDGTYRTFDAVMRNEYRPYTGSDCSDLLEGDERIADELPCTVSYELEGERD